MPSYSEPVAQPASFDQFGVPWLIGLSTLDRHLLSPAAARRFSDLPRILIFMMPEVIHLAIMRLHLEIEIIWFPPGFHDRVNLDLLIIYQKRDRSFICPGT